MTDVLSNDIMQSSSDDDDDAGIDFEIEGLNESDNGRSCCMHECCGSNLFVGALVRVRSVGIVGMFSSRPSIRYLHGFLPDKKGSLREALACYLIWDGTEACRLGFLPTACLRVKERFHAKFAQVCEIYDNSDSSRHRRKSQKNRGMAGCALLDEIPLFE